MRLKRPRAEPGRQHRAQQSAIDAGGLVEELADEADGPGNGRGLVGARADGDLDGLAAVTGIPVDDLRGEALADGLDRLLGERRAPISMVSGLCIAH